MKILFIGDIVGKNGRETVERNLAGLKKKYQIDFVIANGENVTHGKGIIYNHYKNLVKTGVDCITLGNHYDSKSEIKDYIDGATSIIRPYNLEKEFPGTGTVLYKGDQYSIRVTNLLGRAFMEEKVKNPFDCLKEILEHEERADIHIVDFHAEATGEKQCMGWAFDGQVSAVLGTHTHVQTRDARILPNGTAFMSDVGMVGAYNGILGDKKEAVINRVWHDLPGRFEVDDRDDSVLSAVVLDIDPETGRAQDIIPVYLLEKK